MRALLFAASILVAASLVVAAIAFQRSSAPEDAYAPSLEHVHGLAVDRANPRRLLIATHHGLLQLENDSDLTQVGTSVDDLMGFSAHPTEPNIFFSSGHPARAGNIGFQKTTDGGRTWQKLSSGIGGPVDFHAMAVGANPDIVYGYFGGLQRSEDGGITWEMTKAGIAPIALSTDPSSETVFAATQHGVLKSDDRGDTWKSLSPTLEGGAIAFFAIAPDASYALTFSEKLGGMGKSVDGGVTWKRVEERFNGAPVLYVAFGAGAEVYALAAPSGIWKSTDAGETWTKVR